MGLLFFNIAFIFSFDRIYPEECKINCIAEVTSMKEKKTYYNKYIVRVLENKEIEKSKNTKLIIYVDKKLNFVPSDVINICGNFQKAEENRNYGGFNYRRFLKQEKIYGIVYCDKVIKIGENSKIINFEKVRLYISNKIESIYDGEYSDFLNGILIGKKEGISDDIKENFKNSSISHILAISGMHVTYIVVGLTYFLKKILKSNKLKNTILIFFLISFTAITGFSVSCIRACIMNIMVLLSGNIYRKNNFYISFIFSLIIILIINPFNIFNVGMWLSYAGTLGIVMFYNFFVRFYITKINKIIFY